MRIRCSEVPQVMVDVLGDEASAELRVALTSHVTGCQACAREHEHLSAVLRRARAVDVPEPPAEYWPGFLPELRGRIECQGVTPVRTQFAELTSAWLRPAAAVAAFGWLTLSALPPFEPGPRPRTTIAWSTAQLAEVEALASSLDPIGAGALLSLLRDDDPFQEGAEDRPFASGDLFSFLELAATLGTEETLRLLEDDGRG